MEVPTVIATALEFAGGEPAKTVSVKASRTSGAPRKRLKVLVAPPALRRIGPLT
jgi:hypothetical protein